MIIYGYRALYFNTKKDFPNSERLTNSDYDIILVEAEYSTFFKKIEKDLISIREIKKNKKYFIKTKKANYDVNILVKTKNITSNHLLYKETYNNNKILTCPYGNRFDVVATDFLYELKKSHRFIRKNHKKTMNDFYYILDNYIDKKEYIESEFYRLRFQETLVNANRSTKHIKLNQDKDGFFDTKGVTYIYDHDSIHRAVSFYKKPLYINYLKENESVLCDKNKWEILTYEDKCKAVLEEAYVIAIERYLSKNSKKTRLEAFETGLEKICTTLCKGWFREFAYENYRTILNMYSNNFYDKFVKDLNSGLILPFEEKVA
jgi:hypothetical protein